MEQAGQISPDGSWFWNGVQWVPHQQPPGGMPLTAHPYESARGRSVLVVVFLAANLASDLLITIGNVVAVDLPPANPSDSQKIAMDLLVLGSAVLYLGTLVAATVFFCMWLHRVVRNMPALGSADPRWKPSGAVWRCFIPILNLFHPLFSVLDAWRGSDPGYRYLSEPARKGIGFPVLIRAWWLCWLVAHYLGRFEVHSTGAYLDAADGALLVAAAALAILVVRGLTARQDLKSELIAGGRLS